jgi:uroporphyrinogen decarboxylase
MRQAGRYLPEYRALRERAGSFLDLCYNPDLAAEVTVQPLRRFDLDAAILFADILVVPHAMGLALRFEEGEGPVLGQVEDRSAVDALKTVRGSFEVNQVCGTVARVRGLLAPGKSLIGFCGGPWTVASYMIAGGSSDRVLGKVAAYRREPWFIVLIERLITESIEYLSAQIEAGAEVVQIFDSWASDLCGSELEEFVIEPIREISAEVTRRHPSVPVIGFARGIGRGHERLASVANVKAVGIETEMPLAEVNVSCAVQGNLDPVALLAGPDVARREAERICRSISKDRHIFNLGHGIRVGTDPEVVESVVTAVRSLDG